MNSTVTYLLVRLWNVSWGYIRVTQILFQRVLGFLVFSLFFKRTAEQMLFKIYFFPSEIFILWEVVHEGRDLCLFCSLVYSKHLEECQAHERYSVNIWWRYEWFLNVRFCCLNYANAFYRAPNCVKRISTYLSLCTENFTQTSDLPPKGDFERGFFLGPSMSSGYY